MEVTCNICFEPMTSKHEIYATTCGHVFHKTCMEDWLKRSVTCPHCRSYIGENYLNQMYLNFTKTDDSLIESHLKDYQNQIDGLWGRIIEQTNEIISMNRRITVLKADVAFKDARIDILSDKLRLKKTLIKGMKKQSKKLDEQLGYKNRQLYRLNAELALKDDKMQKVAKAIEDVNRSTGLAMKFEGTREKPITENSQGRRTPLSLVDNNKQRPLPAQRYNLRPR